MSLLDGFEENFEIFRGNENRIDNQAFENLVEEHGLSFATGYLKAMYEFTEVVGSIMVIKLPSFSISEKPHTVFNKMSNLHAALFKFFVENGIDTERLIPPERNNTRLDYF